MITIFILILQNYILFLNIDPIFNVKILICTYKRKRIVPINLLLLTIASKQYLCTVVNLIVNELENSSKKSDIFEKYISQAHLPFFVTYLFYCKY